MLRHNSIKLLTNGTLLSILPIWKLDLIKKWIKRQTKLIVVSKSNNMESRTCKRGILTNFSRSKSQCWKNLLILVFPFSKIQSKILTITIRFHWKLDWVTTLLVSNIVFLVNIGLIIGEVIGSGVHGTVIVANHIPTGEDVSGILKL